jgi:hypothetical protein
MKDLKQAKSRKTRQDSVNRVNIVKISTKLQTEPNRSNESSTHNGHSLGIKYRLGITGLAIVGNESFINRTKREKGKEKHKPENRGIMTHFWCFI